MAVGNNSGYRATIGKNEFDPWDASGERAAEHAYRYGGSPSTMAYLADQQAAVEQAGNEQARRWQAQQDRGGFVGGVKRALPYAAMLGATAATGGLAGPAWVSMLRAAPSVFGGMGAVTGSKAMRNIGTVAGLANLGYGLYGGGAGAASQTAAGAATDTAGQAVGDIAMNGTGVYNPLLHGDDQTTMGSLWPFGGGNVAGVGAASTPSWMPAITSTAGGGILGGIEGAGVASIGPSRSGDGVGMFGRIGGAIKDSFFKDPLPYLDALGTVAGAVITNQGMNARNKVDRENYLSQLQFLLNQEKWKRRQFAQREERMMPYRQLGMAAVNALKHGGTGADVPFNLPGEGAFNPKLVTDDPSLTMEALT